MRAPTSQQAGEQGDTKCQDDHSSQICRRSGQTTIRQRRIALEELGASLMRRREASINDVAIDESEKRLFGPREDGDTSGIPLQ